MGIKIHRQFTWQEWLDKCTNPPADGWQASDDDTWAGGSIEQALEMATVTGYNDAVPDAEHLAEGLVDTVAAQVSMETFTFHYDVVGSDVDVATYLTGTPECMVYAKPVQIAKAGRAIRIVVPFGFRCGINADVVRRRGAAVMALVYVLQRLQHPLEVWGSFAFTDGSNGGRIDYLVEVQRADDPTDIGRVMYALAHPTMLRRLGFRVQDHETASVRMKFGIPGWRGAPTLTVKADLPDQQGHDIVLPPLTSNHGWSVEESVSWIESQLADIFGDR